MTATQAEWKRANTLVHYTRSIDAVVSILKNGFMLVPNKRLLINRLLGTDGFKHREPQEFGMVSFTELPRDHADRHRESFGEYGIMVSWEWAETHLAQRVLYLGDGQALESFAWLFRLAKQELERGYPERLIEGVLVNKVIAGMYGQMYYHLLTLYEYMQTERDSSQVEWRIVNKIPQYLDTTDRRAMMAMLMSWASNGVNTIKVNSDDVCALICPADKAKQLREALPSEFGSALIIPCKRAGIVARAIDSFLLTLRSATIRQRAREQRQAGHAVIVRLPELEGIPGRYALPGLKSVMGVVTHGDDVIDNATCTLQYKTASAEECELGMPFLEAVRLTHYLVSMIREPGLRHLVELAVQRDKE